MNGIWIVIDMHYDIIDDSHNRNEHGNDSFYNTLGQEDSEMWRNDMYLNAW